MSGYFTPVETRISPDKIPEYRATRHKTQFQGCTQLNQLFLKADGKISCSCMRYWDILADAKETNIGKFANGELMRYIRESFSEGYEPFAICGGCASRWTETKIEMEIKSVGLHIEPSSQCNLYCEACTCTFERLSDNPPKRVTLDFATFEKVLCDIVEAGLGVSYIAFVGFGEPLFNSRVPDMARLARSLFPTTRLFLDTNGNFGDRRAEELADCGLDEIRLGLDGMDQQSYVAYRKNGDFAKAFNFARKLAAAIREKNSATKAVWKYILFRHNDRDDQIAAAVRMADEIGIPIIFDLTVGEIASSRTMDEIQTVVGAHALGCNIDRTAVEAPAGVSAPIESLA